MPNQRIFNLKELIGDIDPERFKEVYNSQEQCLELLSNAKWADGFVCFHCGNEKFCQGKNVFSRRCTRCKREESATAHTIFHHCRMDLPRAFEIVYLVCGSPAMSASAISQVMETRHMTCLNFKKRILQCLQSEGKLISNPQFLVRE
jgi:two-component system, sensor histidine kinase LadS